jgi:hypothetical protein
LEQGVSGKVLRVVQSIYANAKSCVRVGRNLSDLFISNVGVRQGENLSPLLFSLFINDFCDVFKDAYDGLSGITEELRSKFDVFLSLYVLLYADDTLIMTENEGDLQVALNLAYQYCNKWNITVNPPKSKIVVFSRGKIRNLPSFHFNHEPLQVVFDFSYLGVCLNYNNNFQKAKLKQVNQARRAVQSLKAKINNLDLPFDIQWHLFNNTVAPILLYGSEVWGFESCEVIDVFQRKFLRGQLRLHRATPNCMVYGETGQIKLSLLAEKRLLTFWSKLAFSENTTKLSTVLYNLMKKMHSEGEIDFKWGAEVRGLLDRYGFGGLWDHGQGVSSKWFSSAIGLRIKDVFEQNWRDEVWHHESCKNYRIYKSDLAVDSAMLTLNKHALTTLIQFRCANLSNQGKRHFRSTATSERCPFCDSECWDEFHLLLLCPKFNDIRKKTIPPYFRRNSNTLKFKQLMSSRSKKNSGCSL